MPTLRPAVASDRPFLVELYAETRAAELSIVPWTDEQRGTFLDLQFRAQDNDYHSRYPTASFDVVLADGEAVGRLYVDRSEETLHLIDIAVVAAWQHHGIGTVLLADLLDEAVRSDRPVTLFVDSANPVRAWYERLGFVTTGENALYTQMTWRPPRSSRRS